MIVLGINCSPRKGGNTELLINEALDEAKKDGAIVEMLRIADLEISPCEGCNSCQETGECKIKDDMQQVYQKVLKADGIILGSPVYFWSVSSLTKIFMDRTYALRYPYHRLKHKVCGGIVVAGRRGCMSALEVINNFFLGQDMLPVGLGIAGYGNEKGDVRQDEKAIKSSISMGKKVTNLIKLLKSCSQEINNFKSKK